MKKMAKFTLSSYKEIMKVYNVDFIISSTWQYLLMKSGTNGRSNYDWNKVLETVVSHLKFQSKGIFFLPLY